MEGTPCSSMAPSGSYILIVISHPVSEDHKSVILRRLDEGLLSWDIESTGCDLTGLQAVCSNIDSKSLEDNDVLIQHSTESLGVEVLVNPTVSTLKQCVKNLLSTSTGHKHIIHAGYTFAGSGSWILQNGTFSYNDFLDIFQHADVQSQKRCYINIHCAEVGDWTNASFAKEIFTKVANVALNPPNKVDKVPGAEHLIGCLGNILTSQGLEQMMEASQLVGNIRFNRPTIYMFPAGQGDCALFGINGFNMLIDGGFNRKPCSWEFIRHLDRLDAVLVTRLSENNLCGMSTLMKRKALNNTYPQIGYVFCNIAENQNSTPKEEMAKDKDDLVISVVGEGHNFIQTLNDLKLKPHQCWRDSSIEPFVLYHKVGHGTLEMHVLSPPRDSKEMKDFLSEWSSYKETFSCIKSQVKSKYLEGIPLSHATSVCAILVWRPADPKDTITRILFPGSAPQSKIFESLEKLKTLDILQYPTVTKASLASLLIEKPKANKVEKSITKAAIPNRKNTASPALSVSSAASRNGDIGGLKKEVKEIKKIKKESIINKDNKEREIKREIKKEATLKNAIDNKKDTASVKKDTATKEVKKETKEVKKVVKKEVKAVAEKKLETKAAPKKQEPVIAPKSTLSEPKKAAAAKKSTTTTKKETLKPAAKPEARKSAPAKLSELKTTKEVANRKVAEAKTAAPKTKPKAASAAKTERPKTAPAKPSGKVTKAVAASSIVASAVAVTVAAVELSEKRETIVDEEPLAAEPEKEAEVEIEDTKKMIESEKPQEEAVAPSPVPPVSPTPSESVSLTPSDTLSSAPLETVSPTPPLANEPISTEEKEVNEIKDIDQDLMPYEKEMPTEDAKVEDEDIIEEPAKPINPMAASFIEEKEYDEEVEEAVVKDSANVQYAEHNVHEFQSEQEVITAEESVDDYEVQPMVMTPVVAPKPVDDRLETTDYEYKSMDITNITTTQAVIEQQQLNDDNEIQPMDIDSQLANASMDGSFCAGMIPMNEQELVSQHATQDDQPVKHIVQDEESESESEDEGEEIVDKNERVEEIKEKYESEENKVSAIPEEPVPISTDDHVTESDMAYENQEVLMDDHREFDSELIQSSKLPESIPEYKYSETYQKDFSNYEYSGMQSAMKSMQQAEELDYGISASQIVNDTEMQESSVDDVDDEIRKEPSAPEAYERENYEDLRQLKSGTESEDEDEMQHYGKQESIFEKEQLNIPKRDADSDEDDDVVKSPTPHAYISYEGNKEIDADVAGIKFAEHKTIQEKEDFDEKDRDSTEEQEDDGEMIIHDTPERQYTEEEMRDPIGQHFITAPMGMMKPQASEFAEQPIYEEPDDSGSERSQSPLVEQPVFGSTVKADFPELVTVSGGTTPSEPQSPKSTFEPKKFNSDAALGVMDALSEHDLSEGSTHSPLCHDGANAFELPVKESYKEQNLGTSAGSFTGLSQPMAPAETHELDANIHSKNEFDVAPIEGYYTGVHDAEILDNQNKLNPFEADAYDSKTDVNSEFDSTKGNVDSKSDKSNLEMEQQELEEELVQAGKDEQMHSGYKSDSDCEKSDVHDERSDLIDKSHDDKSDDDDDYGKPDCHDGGESGYPDEDKHDFHDDSHDYQDDEKYDQMDKYNIDDYKSRQVEDKFDYDSCVPSDKLLDQPMGFTDQSENIPSQVPPGYGSTEQTELAFDTTYFIQGNVPIHETVGHTVELDENIGMMQDEMKHQLNFEHAAEPHLADVSDFTQQNVADDRFDNFYSNKNETYESNVHEDISPQHAENVTVIENKILTEVSEAHKYDMLSQYEEKVDTSSRIDSESSSFNILMSAEKSGAGNPFMQYDQANANFDFNEDMKPFPTSEAYSYEKITTENVVTEKYEMHSQYVDEMQPVEHFSDGYDSAADANKMNILPPDSFQPPQNENVDISESYQHSAEEAYPGLEPTQAAAGYQNEDAQRNGFNPVDVPPGYADNLPGNFASRTLNGQEQFTTSEYREETTFESRVYSESSTNNLEKTEESSYVINSRYMSDSPEDNVMRTDSSPDVPYPAAELKNSLSNDSQASEFMQNVRDFTNNMNFPNSGTVPAPLNNTKNYVVDDEGPYGDSSEDEDSASPPGTVSPYAYTNKAYAREEDMDGNHIYKESLTIEERSEITKQIDFDGNNPQMLDTRQISSMMSQGLQDVADSNYEFHPEQWGKPMGLPTPPDNTKTKKKTLTKLDANGKGYSPTLSKMSSPVKKPKPKSKEATLSSPVYVDLAYVPQHGDPQYCDVEFFRKIRARYYVFSGINPSKEVLNALLEAKKSWNEDLEVTIIPTYETDTLGYWMAQNQDALAEHSIEIAPSASRCTVNLQDHKTSCAAYRLEF